MPKEFRLYDTMSRKVKPLATLEPGHLKFYSCGPTVYSYAHIGNFRTFLTGDLVVRTAIALGWKVSYVSNITDVGHLTEDDVSDAQGEDKMEKALKSKEGEQFVNVWELAEHYAQAFVDDWDILRLTRPLVWPRATQHMREQIVAIEKLIADGHAYITESAVYFRLQSFEHYGKLSGNSDIDALKTAVRDVVVDESKEHPGDFALWKRDENHLMQWYSPWGWGFPGWHIECSVMAMQYLGETIDLHAGGEDLVFPHHESEIAQSECLTGKEFSNHWMHTKFLLVDGEKMSKSKGNWLTVRDLIHQQKVNPIALRYALLTVPYGKQLNFTSQTLSDANKNAERFQECRRLLDNTATELNNLESLQSNLKRLVSECLDALCDDLNTSVALAKALEVTSVVFKDVTRFSEEDRRAAILAIDEVDALLGIAPKLEQLAAQDESSVEIEALVIQRNQAKADKNFGLADELRKKINSLGFELRDTPEGTTYKRKTGV